MHAPSAMAFIAINCACISVKCRMFCSTNAHSFWALLHINANPIITRFNHSPQLRSIYLIRLPWFWVQRYVTQLFHLSSQPHNKNVPASIRSGTTPCSAPCNSSTPSIVMVYVPMPWIFAPILTKHSAKSITSGSTNSFLKLFSSAKVAAINKFFCTTYGYHVHHHTCAFQFTVWRNRFNITMFNYNLCTHRFQTF